MESDKLGIPHFGVCSVRTFQVRVRKISGVERKGYDGGRFPIADNNQNWEKFGRTIKPQTDNMAIWINIYTTTIFTLFKFTICKLTILLWKTE